MPRFEAARLSVGYGKPLLTDISFSADEREIVGILGRNGGGKTTLLRGIAGSIRRYGGDIRVDGQSLTRMTPRQQAAYISVLPQQSDVMDGILARDLIAMGRYPYAGLFGGTSPQDAERVEHSAQALGIGHLLDSDCAKLSQGQRQLVMLARCLTQDTPVMLLDEPNAALDYDNTQTMFDVVRTTVKACGKTALLVLHDPELALHWCDRLLILSDGQICADLTVADASAQAVERALSRLYPSIYVREDPFDGRFRCYPI